MEMTSLLLREWNALLMASVWVAMAVAERAFPEHFAPGRLVNRMEPVFPIVACTLCAVFVPGPWMPDDVVIGQKVVLGVVMGAGAYNFAGLAKRFGLTPFITKLAPQKLASKRRSAAVAESKQDDESSHGQH